jgi:hypothetical protein
VPDVPGFRRHRRRAGPPRRLFRRLDAQPHLRAFALAIVGAEYVLRWLPVGTHRWEKVRDTRRIRRSAARRRAAGATPSGMVYNPLAISWRLSRDTAVNYFITAGQSARLSLRAQLRSSGSVGQRQQRRCPPRPARWRPRRLACRGSSAPRSRHSGSCAPPRQSAGPTSSECWPDAMQLGNLARSSCSSRGRPAPQGAGGRARPCRCAPPAAP